VDFTRTSLKKENDLAAELRAQLSESISVRLQSDPSDQGIGTFLSGGVDSSTVTGLLSRTAKAPIKSFSIGFDEQRFNEINYARIAARAFGVEHHEYFVTPTDVLDAIPLLIESFDEPFANASAVPTYYCAKLAREHGVDFLYAGDGGDELFAGNERYATQRLFDYYQNVPAWLRRGLVEPVTFTLADNLKWDLLVKGKKYICRSNVPYPERLSSYGLFKMVSPAEWFEDDFLDTLGQSFDPYEAMNACYSKASGVAELDRQLYIDLKLAISDNDLFKVTRMTEAAGVAVRFPFLDHHLAEFASRVPAHLKMSGLKLRTFFKKAYSDLLPKEILTKTKHGFGLPIPVWLRTDRRLNEMMRDFVLSARSLQRGYFRPETIRSVVEMHKTDESSFYGAILWNLMILELWHRRWAPPIPSAEARRARLDVLTSFDKCS
jgi:asparagine synthase (glutamine-hydrolysing)